MAMEVNFTVYFTKYSEDWERTRSSFEAQYWELGKELLGSGVWLLHLK